MRRLQSFTKFGPTIALVAGLLASSVALANQAGSIPLSTLNGGPSSEIIPSAAGSKVAFWRYASEVVNPAIVAANPAAPVVDATTIQVSTTGGIRNRERSLLTGNSDVRAGTASHVEAVNTGFANGASAADSYIGFLTVAQYNNTPAVVGITGVIDTIAKLEIFFTANPTQRVALSNAALNAGAGFANGDLDNADLATGINFTTAELNAAIPGYAFNQLAVVVFDDRDDAIADIPTEFAEIVANSRQAPVDAAFDANNQIIRIVTNRPINDNEAGNPTDGFTTPAAADFLVVPSGGGAPTVLATFLTASAPSSSGVDAVSVEGDRNDIIRIDLNSAVSVDAERTAILGGKIFFATNDVSSVVGDNTANNPAQAQTMKRAAELTLASAKLLQGTGQFNNNDIWVAIDLSDSASNAGDGQQFDLVATVGGEDVVVATGFAAQFTVPTSGDVAGIDDLNLDGTLTDPVISTANNRLFVEFDLDDGDDAINSDGTWSDNAGFDNQKRAIRKSLRVVVSGNGTSASSALGGGITEGSETPLLDLARPQIVGYCTRATGTDAQYPLCQAVDALFFVFDEAVTINATAPGGIGRAAVRFNSGILINDLTAGLSGQLALFEATTASSSATLPGLITPTPTVALAEFAVANDSVALTAPKIPITAPAKDGTAAATGILPGTGFPDGDSPYKLAADNNLVSTTGFGGVTLGNVKTPGVTFATGVLTAGGEDVDDCAPPALVAANASGGSSTLGTLRAGFSEVVFQDGSFSTDEAESYFFIMDNSAAGVRHRLDDAEVTFSSFFEAVDNVVLIDLFDNELSTADTADPGFVLAVFNPGFPIIDDPGNRINPNTAKSKMVDIGRPSATLLDFGVATVDTANDKVISIAIKANGLTQLSTDGTLEDLAQRFYVRGRSGGNTGEPVTLAGLVASITIAPSADSTGNFVITLTFMEGMPFPQETFAVEYLDTTDQPEPTDTFLVDAAQPTQEIPSAIIEIDVLRAPVVEGDPSSPDGNILGMTIAGTVNLGEDENALGAEVTAWIWHPLDTCGAVSFTFKGVRYTGLLDVVDSDGKELITNGTVLYFHSQLQGEPGEKGTMSPCGVINSCPDIDLYQTNVVTNSAPDANGGTVSVTNNIPLYAGVAKELVATPVALTFAKPTSTTATSNNIGTLTFMGTSVTNGRLVTGGRFEEIGSTRALGEADSDGARPYTLHTRGQKNFKGLPVIIMCNPLGFFSELDTFLCNDFFHNGLFFIADMDTRGSTSPTVPGNLPVRIFNINRSKIIAINVTDLVFDNWGFFAQTTRGGSNVDFGTSLANRVLGAPVAPATTGMPLNGMANFPAGVDARGAFVFLNKDEEEPYIPLILTALLIDSKGVFCDVIGKLDRIQSGWSTVLEFDSDPVPLGFNDFREFFDGEDCWFQFGDLLSDSSGAVLVLTNGTNGGWNTTANLRSTAVTAIAFPGEIVILLNGALGVTIGGELIDPLFADAPDVEGGWGVLSHQNAASVNNPAN